LLCLSVCIMLGRKREMRRVGKGKEGPYWRLRAGAAEWSERKGEWMFG